jgi:predicted ester cyclase
MIHTPAEQANIDAIHRFMEAEAIQDWDTVYQFIAPDCVAYAPGGVVTRGHDAMHASDEAMFSRLASWRREILDIAADGDKLVFRWRAEFVLHPSGKRGAFEGLAWTHWLNGQMTETWSYFDSAEVRRQMTPAKEATQ